VGQLRLDRLDLPYKTADSVISADVEIKYAPFFRYNVLYTFLLPLVLFICSDTRSNFERGKAEITSAITGNLWDQLREPDDLHQFNMYIVGRPLNYFKQGEIHEESKRFWESFEKSLNTALANR
jgi:hypothetical protein